MYIIKNKHRNAYKTCDGWTSIENGVLVGLHNVLRFTTGEMEANKDALAKQGSEFIYFPRRRWKDMT